MKKLNLTNIIEGVRKLGAVKAFFAHIEEAYTETLSDISRGLVADSASYIVLYGCENSGSGSNYVISAGAVLKDGEIYQVPAHTETADPGEVPVLTLNTVNDTLKYTDATDQTTLVTRTLQWSMAASGSGLVDFSALVTLKSAVRTMLDVSREISVSEKGADYVLVLSDNGKNIDMNVGAANTVTVPTNASVAFPIGTTILITQKGTGQTSIVAAGGVTVQSEGGILSIAAQYGGAALHKIGTNTWRLYGALGA